MEMLIGLAIAVIVGLFLISKLSSNETKLFRTIWSSEKIGANNAQQKAMNDLLEIFDIKIPAKKGDANIEKLGDGLGRLIAKASEFDAKHPNNFGILVTKILATRLEWELHAANIHDFDQPLKAAQNVDIELLARSMPKTMSVDLDKSVDLEGLATSDNRQRDQFLDDQDKLTHMFNILSQVEPISSQLGDGIGENEVPEGGIIDPYIRGYFLGYVNSLLELTVGGGVDEHPKEAFEAFAVLNGATYDGDMDRGAKAFNECLADRHTSSETESETPFDEGFSAGAADHKKFYAGSTPDQLKSYVENKLNK